MSESNLLLDIVVTYLGEDEIRRYRSINKTSISEEFLVFPELTTKLKVTLVDVVCKNINEIGIFVVLNRKDESGSLRLQTYNWKWLVEGSPWYEYFKFVADIQRETASSELLRFISMIQLNIINRLFL